jgi:hypothetical protein
MVFTEYGDHWRRMRRVMTLPFFTMRVVQGPCGRPRWTTSSPTCTSTRRHAAPASWCAIIDAKREALFEHYHPIEIIPLPEKAILMEEW